ncbi:MAG: putative zinc-binding metallopeptidase [Candidatus Omnitrophota bacterium]|nr:putative zinc-binding metallopeptidase [Candidatus Omnitrophota bacterium]
METKPSFRIKEEDLLEKRISDLGLQISQSVFSPLIQKLYHELDQKGLVFRPPCFLADEWFAPVGVPAIGIPFFLAHPRLRKLEQKIILEVEGGTRATFMKLIRHEAGHAYSYAYGLYKKKRWRRLFGLASKEYPDTYKPRPYSHSYVQHLENWYAQSHPDEDFAETFAVWLTPGLNWKRRYRGWKAFGKLEYVDKLMKSIMGKSPRVRPHFNPDEYSGLRIKLKTYYRNKKKQCQESYPDFYDNDLKALFTDDPDERSDTKAYRYLTRSHEKILRSVAFWTKEKKYTIDQLMRDLIYRCRGLNLYIRKENGHLDFEVSSFITSLVTTYLHTGTFKRSK